MEDPDSVTQSILEAVRLTGVRVIVSRGWANLGRNVLDNDTRILFIGDCPHGKSRTSDAVIDTNSL